MMCSRSSHLLLLAIILALPSLVCAQASHDKETEIMQPPPGGRIAPDRDVDLGRCAAIVIEATNGFRKDEKRPPVRVNKVLTETAQSFARYMASTDRYGHRADGNQPADRATKQGYDYCIVLENIAYYYNSGGTRSEDMAREFFEGWKKSPGHRRNMLDPDVRETGVAVARSEKTGYYYAVQLFGRPGTDRIEFRLANRAGIPVEYKLLDKSYSLPPGYTRLHQVCRPPTVTLSWSADKEPDARRRTTTLQPTTGKRYLLEKGKQGELRITEQANGE